MSIRNIVVTGATSGIGKEITKTLLDLGYNVAFCGRSKDKMQRLINDLPCSCNYMYSTFDLTNEEEVDRFVDKAVTLFGHIDVLINCAGANSSRSSVSDLKTSDLLNMININLVAPFTLMREVYNKSMRERKSGIIINILSTVCNFSNEGIGAYTASKTGFDGLLKVFRKEVRENNIKVCSVYPGGVDTPFRDVSRPLYLKPETVANAVISILDYDDNACIDELTIRPMVEKNYC
ncbi:MAG: SDR family oxidoreductase [Spirochaetales bacterium]|nr:SDR family oxidoreductase [Spirochaetales bacterium]